jgi:hypothetical protein
MRAGAARGHVGHYQEAGFYGCDAEFAALIVPFAEEGIAAGEPVIIGYDDRKSGLLRSWLTDPSAVDFIGDKGGRSFERVDSSEARQQIIHGVSCGPAA